MEKMMQQIRQLVKGRRVSGWKGWRMRGGEVRIEQSKGEILREWKMERKRRGREMTSSA